MHILIVPDSFKGSLSSIEAAQCIDTGFRRVFPSCTSGLLPVADGGEGTVEALVAGAGGRIVTATVSDPLGRPVEAQFGLLEDGWAVIEMAQASAPRFDAERYGMIYRSSPRQTDILLVNGWISKKIRPHIRRLWEEIPAPKWAVAMGECAISGGPWYDSYNTVQGLDQIVPVDLYIPGCPARPDAMIDGFMLLQKKIDNYFRRGAFLKD